MSLLRLRVHASLYVFILCARLSFTLLYTKNNTIALLTARVGFVGFCARRATEMTAEHFSNGRAR